MVQSIPVPNSSYSIQRLNINNTIYNLQLSFNSRDSAWYMDLFDIQMNPILQSRKLQWGSGVTSRYILPQLVGGNFYIVKTKNSNDLIGRDNFGEDKLYELWFVTSDSEVELLDGISL